MVRSPGSPFCTPHSVFHALLKIHLPGASPREIFLQPWLWKDFEMHFWRSSGPISFLIAATAMLVSSCATPPPAATIPVYQATPAAQPQPPYLYQPQVAYPPAPGSTHVPWTETPNDAPPPATPSQEHPPASAPSAQAKPVTHHFYYCPMHPDVVQDSPGKCPTCGMDLLEKN